MTLADIPPAASCEHEPGCITCGDEGVEMRVLRIDAARGLALCSGADGAKSSVEIALIGDVQAGDALLVHAGTAIARLEGASA
jgi:hydrogenase maturation factor